MSLFFANKQLPSIVNSKHTSARMEAHEVVQEINSDVDDCDPSLAESQFFPKGYFFEVSKAMGCIDINVIQSALKEQGRELLDPKGTAASHGSKLIQPIVCLH